MEQAGTHVGKDRGAKPRLLQGSLDELLSREWLITNGRGGYASSTVINCPTRRYHGLLVVSKRPPLERIVLLSALTERLVIGGQEYELGNFEFNHVIHPRGYEHLEDFACSLAPPAPQVCFTYALGAVTLRKRIVMRHGQDRVDVFYELSGVDEAPWRLEVRAFIASRDFHALRRRSAGEAFELHHGDRAVWLKDLRCRGVHLGLMPVVLEGQAKIHFDALPDWWYNFRYRQEAARGLDCGEDLYTPGVFQVEGRGRVRLRLSAVFCASEPARIDEPPGEQPHREVRWLRNPPETIEALIERLREAADQFVVTRILADGRDSATILAGYPWFGDWGRDSFIALEGLLLLTRRYEQARQVLCTFASAQRDGLIPNRFDDYGGESQYNSVDASLWFIHAADAYVAATGDKQSWCEVLAPACRRIVEAFVAGTAYDIRVDQDGLVWCGNPGTQITWMDAKCGEVVFTPRHGKCVEINALWYHALCVLTERLAESAPEAAEQCRRLAERVRACFARTFWNPQRQCLYDVVRPGELDDQIRPNQIFAVSLPHTALARGQQKLVVGCVRRHLLTPFGLRSLAPDEPAYHGRYEGGPFERDQAYHQGTVWAWLLGPFIEAYLRVHDFSDPARNECRAMLRPMMNHLAEAGVGTISEIFDGDAPHTPRGCIAQAWSVAEILRACYLVESGCAAARSDASSAALA